MPPPGVGLGLLGANPLLSTMPAFQMGAVGAPSPFPGFPGLAQPPAVDRSALTLQQLLGGLGMQAPPLPQVVPMAPILPPLATASQFNLGTSISMHLATPAMGFTHGGLTAAAQPPPPPEAPPQPPQQQLGSQSRAERPARTFEEAPPEKKKSRSRSRRARKSRSRNRKKSRSRSRRKSRSRSRRKNSRSRSRGRRKDSRSRSGKRGRRSRSRGNRRSRSRGVDLASEMAKSIAKAQAMANDRRGKQAPQAWPAPVENDISVDWTRVARQPVPRVFLPSYEAADPAAAAAIRATLGVVVESDPAGLGLTPAPLNRFADIPILPSWIKQALAENNWDTPMPIQAQALPILLAGKSIIGIAQTGSGKTVAFLIPMVIHACAQSPLTQADQGPIGLVLAPTRELAVQISEEADKLTKHSYNCQEHRGGIRSVAFYGGGKKWDQLGLFTREGSHIVVATPGRLLDFCSERKVSLRRVTYLVLDEADRMLEMGFQGDMERVSSAVRPERQMCFFSATWPKEVQALACTFCQDAPVTLRVGGAAPSLESGNLMARKGIKQHVVVVDFPGETYKPWIRQEAEKRKLLEAHIKEVLVEGSLSKMIVFVNEKGFADELANKMYEEGIWDCNTLHGGRPQQKRLEVLDQFRKGDVRLLIATDVMGRGLDVPGVTHVVVFSMGGCEDYIHRIGRTGRGKDGVGNALVFFEYSPKNPHYAKDLIDVLEKSEQIVPPDLRRIADDVASGRRKSDEGGGWWGSNNSWAQGGGNDWKSGGDDQKAKTFATQGISTKDIAAAQFTSFTTVEHISVDQLPAGFCG